MRKVDSFRVMGSKLEEIHATREKVAQAAFSLLEEHLSDFSNMLIIRLGDRTRAIGWMGMRHRNLEGRNAYQVIADGEQDRLWDVLESSSRSSFWHDRNELPSRPSSEKA